MPRYRELQHGMLLRSKNVMDDALCELAQLQELIPEKLHGELEQIVKRFEDTLCEADVANDYIEKEEHEAAMKKQAAEYEKALANYRG